MDNRHWTIYKDEYGVHFTESDNYDKVVRDATKIRNFTAVQTTSEALAYLTLVLDINPADIRIIQ